LLDGIDKAIDTAVYELYGVAEEDIGEIISNCHFWHKISIFALWHEFCLIIHSIELIKDLENFSEKDKFIQRFN
jgi:hypothetical protein